MGWMRVNKLKLNPEKMEVLAIGTPGLGWELCHPVLDGITLPLKDKVHNLGALLDSSLQLSSQVDAMARSAWYQLRLIRQLRPYLNRKDLEAVVLALVISHLDFCNVLYMGLPLYQDQKLQLVQNAAARLVTGTARSDHIPPELKAHNHIATITCR